MRPPKFLLILLAGFALLTFTPFTPYGYGENQAENHWAPHYIIGKDYKASNRPILPEGARMPDGTPVDNALSFFRALQRHFSEKSIAGLDSHFQKVNAYFHASFNPPDAQRLFDLYKKYLNCEISITNNDGYMTKSAAPEEILSLLKKIQTYRRQKLGAQNADALFGQDVKSREYLLRRSIIIEDPRLYGHEKEIFLKALTADMWDHQIPPMEQSITDYDRYQLKLQTFRKDLSEMNEPERELKIRNFRNQCFSKEAIARLEEVDRRIAGEKQNLEQYRFAEKQIINNPALTQKERLNQIKTLQDLHFGNDAEAFRRRESIYNDAKGDAGAEIGKKE